MSVRAGAGAWSIATPSASKRSSAGGRNWWPALIGNTGGSWLVIREAFTANTLLRQCDSVLITGLFYRGEHDSAAAIDAILTPILR